MQPDGRPTIVALGDSTTAGTPGFLSPLESPPDGQGNVESQFAYWLARARPGWTVRNRGVNGERSDQIRARFDRDVLAETPDAVVIIAGVNDVYQGRSAAAVIEQLRLMYNAARTESISVVAGSIVPYNTASPDQNARMREINAWIRDVAPREHGVRFVDTRAAVAAIDDPDRLADSPDSLHPSPSGYRRMADALLPILEDVVSSHGPGSAARKLL
jgi:lysophospholipase L1-like esterase